VSTRRRALPKKGKPIPYRIVDLDEPIPYRIVDLDAPVPYSVAVAEEPATGVRQRTVSPATRRIA
jgi:hypothetical protein